MRDLVFIGTLAGFFGLASLYVTLCDRIVGTAVVDGPAQAEPGAVTTGSSS